METVSLHIKGKAAYNDPPPYLCLAKNLLAPE